jgi:hypothetical protein
VQDHVPQGYAILCPSPWRKFALLVFELIDSPCMCSLEHCLFRLSSFCLFVFETQGAFYIAQAGLKLTLLLPRPHKCWDYRCVPTWMAQQFWHILHINPSQIHDLQLLKILFIFKRTLCSLKI